MEVKDFIIVGAGPSGCVMSLLLSKSSDRQIVLLEKREEVLKMPKAVHLDKHAVMILESLGVNKFKKYPLTKVEYFSNTKELVILEKKDIDKLSSYEGSFWFNQWDLEQELWMHIGKNKNVDFFTNWNVGSLVKKDNFWELKSSNGAILRGKFLISADGSKSFIRNTLKIDYKKHSSFSSKWTVIDLIDRENLLPETHVQCCSKQSPFTYIKFGSSVRIEHKHNSSSYVDILNKYFSFDEEVVSEKFDIIKQADYVFESKLLEKFGYSHVFFVGDSAHLMPPFAGKGLCSGIKDAHALAWKFSKKNAIEHLNMYGKERYNDVVNDINISVFLGKLVNGSYGFFLSDKLNRINQLILQTVLKISNYIFLFVKPKIKEFRFLSLQGYFIQEVFDLSKSCISRLENGYSFKILSSKAIPYGTDLSGVDYLDRIVLKSNIRILNLLSLNYILIRPDYRIAGTASNIKQLKLLISRYA